MNIMKFLHNQKVKNILSALAVAIFGFILLNITFLFDAGFQKFIDAIIGFFTPVDVNMAWNWYPPLKHGLFVILIVLISWFIFKTKLGMLYKAIYMSVPVAVVLATIGIFFYQWPIIPFLLGAFFCIGVIYYLYRTKQPWLYYFTVIFWAIVLAIFTLSGGEI